MKCLDLNKYILNFPDSKLSYPYGQQLSVYSLNDEMFAIIEKDKKPLRISLRCDKHLANVLKERYEEVMPGYKLNKDKWITIVLSGQLNKDEIVDLINHSYLLVSEGLKK